MPIAILNLKPVYQGWATYSVATIRLENGDIIDREIEDHGRAVAVLPFDERRRTAILVRQFRPPVFAASGDLSLLEAIAGIVEESDPADAGRREAQEEAGLHLTALEFVAQAWTMPGLSTERMSLYLARYDESDRRSAGGGLADEHENIVVEELPLAELAAMADSGRLTDMKALVLTQSLRVRHPELFKAR